MIKPIKLNVTRSLRKNKLYYSINSEKVDNNRLRATRGSGVIFMVAGVGVFHDAELQFKIPKSQLSEILNHWVSLAMELDKLMESVGRDEITPKLASHVFLYSGDVEADIKGDR